MRLLLVVVLFVLGCSAEAQSTTQQVPTPQSTPTPPKGLGVSGWEIKDTFEDYGYVFEPQMNNTVHGFHSEYLIGITLYQPMDNLSAVGITYPLVSIEHADIAINHTWRLCGFFGFDTRNLAPIVQDLSEGKRTSTRTFGNIKVTGTEGRLAGMNLHSFHFEGKIKSPCIGIQGRKGGDAINSPGLEEQLAERKHRREYFDTGATALRGLVYPCGSPLQRLYCAIAYGQSSVCPRMMSMTSPI